MKDLKLITLDEDTLKAAMLGFIQVYQLDQPVPYKLTKAEWGAFERAIQSGYVVAQENMVALFNAFYKWCEIHHKPYVAIKWRRKYASVVMDMVSIENPSYRLSGEAELRIKKLFSGFAKYFHTGVYNWLPNAPKEQAKDIAAALVQIYNEDFAKYGKE